MRSKGELKNYKKWYEDLHKRHIELMDRFKICKSCAKYKGVKLWGKDPVGGELWYCARCHKRHIKLNKELSPMITKSLITAAKIVAEHDREKKTQVEKLQKDRIRKQ
jgi:hypothetical protein